MQLQPNAPEGNVGVVVARFQVNELHKGQKDLLETVSRRHENGKVIIVLGVAPLPNSVNNPLDFYSRNQMVFEYFQFENESYLRDSINLCILPLEDTGNNKIWSEKLDGLIKASTNPNDKIVLYGSRESFISNYSGKYPTVCLESETILSGSEIRKKIKSRVRPNVDFRTGVIWATGNRFPTSYQTVDVAIVDDNRKILLGRKENETQWRFIGGFVDVRDLSLENAAIREAREETGLDFEPGTPIHYLGSARIDDWRYRNEPDKIMTSFFLLKRSWGTAVGKDDIEEVSWFPLEIIIDNPSRIVPGHLPLVQILIDKRKEYEIYY